MTGYTLWMLDPVVATFGAGFLRPKGRVYFDAAATSLMPRAVLTAQQKFYATAYANPHTSAHSPGRNSTAMVEAARASVAELFGLNTPSWATLFVGSGSTAALNRAAGAIYPLMAAQGRPLVVTTQLEHHSNLLPWRRAAGAAGLRIVPMLPDGSLDLAAMEAILARDGKRVGVIACSWASNVTGAVTNVDRVAALARKHGAALVMDAAQASPHMQLVVPEGVSAVAISGHKLYAPGSPGVLMIRRGWLEQHGVPVGDTGGGTVEEVNDLGVTFSKHGEAREEAGTPNVGGILGLGLVASILGRIGMPRMLAAEHEMTSYLLDRMETVPGITVYGSRAPGGKPRLGVVAFNLRIPHGAVAAALDAAGICVRNACFCAQPCVRAMLAPTFEKPQVAADFEKYDKIVPGKLGMVRVSLGPWNTRADVDALVKALKWIAANKDGVCERCVVSGEGYVLDGEQCSRDRPCFTLEDAVEGAAKSW